MTQRVLRIGGVMGHTGLAKSTIYLRIQQGSFPKPIPLGSDHAVGWLEADVEAWIDKQVRTARGSAAPLTAE